MSYATLHKAYNMHIFKIHAINWVQAWCLLTLSHHTCTSAVAKQACFHFHFISYNLCVMYLWAISQLLPPKNTKSRTVWLLLFKRQFTELHSSAATYPVVHRGSWWSASNRTSSSDLRTPCEWLVWALVTGNGSLCSEPTPSTRLNCVTWEVFMSHSMYFNHVK